MRTFKTIKSDKGLFINEQGGYGQEGLSYNGKKVERTFKGGWFFLEGETELKTISSPGQNVYVNKRWEIIDKETFPMLKETYTEEEVGRKETDEDGEYEISYKNIEFAKIASLYTYKSDLGVSEPIFHEFKEESVCEVKEIEGPTPFNYEIVGSYGGPSRITEPTYELLTEMTVPEIMRHNYPCKISSVQSYQIIRKYVIENINSQFAEITSNYDFCFTVMKKWKLCAPKVTKREEKKANGRSYASPRITIHTKTHESKQIFEMTHDVQKYQGYTIMEGFKGSTLLALKENIDNYLSELIEIINEPVAFCTHCGGNGAEPISTFKTN